MVRMHSIGRHEENKERKIGADVVDIVLTPYLFSYLSTK